MSTLDKIRHRVSPWILGVLWMNFVLIAIRSVMRTGPFDPIAAIAAGGIVTIATLTWWKDRTGVGTRAITSLANAATVAILVYAFAGSELQIDIHMYFFASLALCSAWIDWRSLIAYAALVAVHHLVFTYTIPFAVFPGEADLARVMLHAVVLVAQCAALIALSIAMSTAFATADESVRLAKLAEREAAEMAKQAELANTSAIEERQQREAIRDATEQSIGHAVASLRQALNGLAKGDMTARIKTPLDGDLNELREAFNLSAEQLEQVLLQVSEVANSIRHGSAQIHEANEDLARRSEQQAHSISAAAGELNDVIKTVGETAQLADRVGRMVSEARTGAEESSTVVHESVQAMRRIENSSQEISKIIGVIDEIAFQTNLLALNAGVEAARAGEAGKGFAVVAQEVRELAQRSATAAKEIKALIRASSSHVNNGVDLVAKAGDALQGIAQEVSEISSHVQVIVDQARSQSTQLHGIGLAIADIDSNTQQTAAMVEESSTAIGSVAGEASELDRLVKGFKTAKHEAKAISSSWAA